MSAADDGLEQQDRKGPLAWLARNAIAANLMMLILFGGGFWTALSIQKEVFPQFALDVVNVGVGYPGAAPSEVEQGILLPIEEAIRGVQGIEEVSSQAEEGGGSVSVELVAGTDRMKAFQDIDQAINRIRTFPEDIDEPEVNLASRQRDVMEIAIYGGDNVWTLRKLAENLRDRLLASGEITQIELGGIPDFVTHVTIPHDTLRTYDLTLDQVAGIIRRSSQDVPAGTIEASTGEILLRMKERKDWARELGAIEIVADPAGGGVTLADIAEVTDGFEDRGYHSRFNRQYAVDLEIFRVGDQSPLDVAEAAEAVLADFQSALPPGVETRIDSNRAEDYHDRLSLLIENGLMAVVIVLAILALFLEFRLAFWVMMGMSVSFIGGLVFLPWIDVSINMISMFAFLVVLGIVVDDAIVVGENIYEHRQREPNALKAAIRGVREMAVPVTFSILTNIVAFVPLLFIPGTTGKFWWPLPAVVIIVLAVSLFEALVILPAHLGHSKGGRSRTGIGSTLHGWQQAFSQGFSRFVERWYRPFLGLCLRARYVTLSVALGLFLLVGGYGLSGHMGMIMMPQVAADEIEAGIRLPVGTTPDQAARVADDVTEATHRMFEEHDLHRAADGIKTNVRGGAFIDVEIVMKPPDQRDLTADDVIELWRDQIGDIPGVQQISFEAERGPGGWQPDIAIDLSHDDIDVLEGATAALVERLEGFEATRDINDNFDRGKDQYSIELLPEGRRLGLTATEVGAQLRGAFYGALASRQLRGTNEVEIRVKLPEAERDDIRTLRDFVIRTPDGAEVPLLDVARIEMGEAFDSINRRNGRRVVTVSTDAEPKSATGRLLGAINAEVLPDLRADFPGLTWTFQGSQAEMRESTQALWAGFGLAMVVIYSLLAVAFGSYTQPFIVISAIPFGIIGAVIGHILLGFDLSLISLMGIIALTGVVVNDSLIMVDYANRRRRDHGDERAIHDAGVRRFRPIILTTATTFGGLTPIILETSRQAAYLVPMAISLGFGIVFATAIILVLVPCLYLVLEDLKAVGRKLAPAEDQPKAE